MRRAAIVGPGRVGTSLALALGDIMEVLGAAGGSESSRRLFARRTGRPTAEDPPALCRQADWVFLTVPDRLVSMVCGELAQAGAFHHGQVVCHTAGSLAAAVLAPAAALGAMTLALHPMQSIADGAHGLEAFRGAVCTLQGDPRVLPAAEELARGLGMRPWRVTAEQKARLHAASVLASNALVGLLAVAAQAAAAPGDDEAREQALSALLPLSEGTLRNLGGLGLPQALTGPVERGDVATVQLHLGLLSGDAARVYRALLPTLVGLAREKGSAGAQRAQEFLQLSAEVMDS